MSDETEAVAVDLEDRGIEGVAQTGGAPQHRREHGLDVGRGAGDDAQDLGRRGLLLQRLGQCSPEAFDLALQVSACDRVARLASVEGPAHSSQNFACGRFSCWHRGQCIPSVSRFRIVSGQPGTSVTAPGSPPKLGVPAVPWGTGAPTLPRPGLGRQMGGSGAWFALEPVGRPRRRLRRVRTHVYATLLTATRRLAP